MPIDKYTPSRCVHCRTLIKSLAETRPPAASAAILYVTSVMSSMDCNDCNNNIIQNQS